MPPRLHCLDVSELEPPEPLDRILARLPELGGSAVLKVRHRREPFPLFALLAETGFHYLCRRLAEAEYRIYIWHQDAGDLGPFCMADLQEETHH